MERVKTRCGAACRDDCRLPVPPAPSGPAAGNTVLGGGKNPLRSAKNPLRGAKNPGATPRFGARKTRFGARKICPGGCPPRVSPLEFSSNFRRIFVEFSSNFRFRTGRFFPWIFCMGKIFRRIFVEFPSNFRRSPAAAPRGPPRGRPPRGPAAAPRGPPPGARASA